MALLALQTSVFAAPTWQAGCQFVLGFADVRAMLPAQVGDCLENQQTNVTNGDAYQRTAGGLLVWRKLDNWTAFTDGYRTWLNGPRGLQQRLNVERFTWEGDAGTPGTTLLVDAPLAPVASVRPTTPAVTAAPAAVPVQPAPASSGVRFVAVQGTSPGRNASVTVQAAASARCSIRYITPLGTNSTAAGLVSQTADASGSASWTWLIGGNTTRGTGSVTVTCNNASASSPIQIG